MKKLMTLIALALFAVSAHSQTLSLSLDLGSLLHPELAWSATGETSSCSASGDWSGVKPASGVEEIPPIRSSSSYGITCNYDGNEFTRVSWTQPTENTDGSPFTNPGPTRVVYTQNTDISTFDCLDPDGIETGSVGFFWVDVPHPVSEHTDTLTDGTWTFFAYKLNTAGICSARSNTATKTIESGVTLTDTVSVGVPNAPSGVGLE